MKITDWRRKLLAACAAGGMVIPTMTAGAAGLGVNLVTNGDFEHVNINITGAYNSPLVLDWTGPNLFAYSHDGSFTATGGPVPDYTDGSPLPGGGHWYFTSNNTNVSSLRDVHDPNVYFQDIDVSTGDTAVAITNGSATYALSAYMTSYLNDADIGRIHAEFRNAVDAPIISAELIDSDPGPNNVWNLNFTTGSVPAGTAKIRLSLYGTSAQAGTGADGFIDNVNFLISGVPEPSTIGLVGVGLAAAAGLTRQRKDS